MTATDLAFRRQFYLGASTPGGLDHWPRLDIGPRLKLSVHPDLDTAQKCDGRDSITLLGFMFDADRPEAKAADILRELWPLLAEPDQLRARTDRCAGRWVVIVRYGERTWLFNDATGMRQVSYAMLDGHIVCASQAALVADAHGLGIDPHAQAFIRARGDSDLDVYWLPGDRTLHPQVSVLLPNHWLDLATGTAHRFWPASAQLQAGDANAVLERCLAMLRGFIAAASRRRGGLAVPMTAGWDSRLVLAMCHSHADDLFCYTFVYPNQSSSTPDVAVPRRLLGRLGLPHHVFDYPRHIDADFRTISRRNAYNGHDAFCADGQVLRDHYPADRLCLTGDVAEIVKSHFRDGSHAGGAAPTPASLADLCGLPPHPFALRALQDWLNDIPSDLPIPVLDLFCWEQMAGRWQAMIRAEYDIVQDSFAPLNSRHLLLQILSVNEDLRRRPDYPFFADLIRQLWPETLLEPINPPTREGIGFKVMKSVARLKLQHLLPDALRDTLRRVIRRV